MTGTEKGFSTLLLLANLGTRHLQKQICGTVDSGGLQRGPKTSLLNSPFFYSIILLLVA